MIIVFFCIITCLTIVTITITDIIVINIRLTVVPVGNIYDSISLTKKIQNVLTDSLGKAPFEESFTINLHHPTRQHSQAKLASFSFNIILSNVDDICLRSVRAFHFYVNRSFPK